MRKVMMEFSTSFSGTVGEPMLQDPDQSQLGSHSKTFSLKFHSSFTQSCNDLLAQCPVANLINILRS